MSEAPATTPAAEAVRDLAGPRTGRVVRDTLECAGQRRGDAGARLARRDPREAVVLAVMPGLVPRKSVGIVGAAWLAVRSDLCQLPAGATSMHSVGAALLGGIGFTASIFITELAFTGATDRVAAAKTGILFASLAAGVAGYLWLRFTVAASPSTQRRSST